MKKLIKRKYFTPFIEQTPYHLFEDMGTKTGVDLEKLLNFVRLAEQMAGIRFPGHLLRARKVISNRRRAEAFAAASNHESINRGGFQYRLDDDI